MNSGGVLRRRVRAAGAATAALTNLRSLKRSVVFTRDRPFCFQAPDFAFTMSIVMKFGGTSVADAAALENVASIIAAQQHDAPVVVISAMSGVTDALLASTRLAAEHRVDDAIQSLSETFDRHNSATEQLLAHDSSNHFSEYLDNAATQISKLLQRTSETPESYR